MKWMHTNSVASTMLDRALISMRGALEMIRNVLLQFIHDWRYQAARIQFACQDDLTVFFVSESISAIGSLSSVLTQELLSAINHPYMQMM